MSDALVADPAPALTAFERAVAGDTAACMELAARHYDFALNGHEPHAVAFAQAVVYARLAAAHGDRDDTVAFLYHAADNTTHMEGSTFDMLPPAGKSLGWLSAQVKRHYPASDLLVHDGHLHGRFPGYYGAPAIGGARKAGLRNPLQGMPPPPAGFSMDAR